MMTSDLDTGPRPADDPAAGRRRLGRTTLVGLLGVVAVVTLVVALRGGAPDPGTEATSPQQLADAMAGVAPDGIAPLDERLAPDTSGPLPPVTLGPFADGPARPLEDYAGTPLVVNFWASWCGPCVDEMPVFDSVADRAGSRVAILGVNRDDRAQAAQELVAELGVDYDLATDADDSLFRAVRGFGMPTTLFVDADGVIRHRHTGALDGRELVELLDRVLGVEVTGGDAPPNGAQAGGVDE